MVLPMKKNCLSFSLALLLVAAPALAGSVKVPPTSAADTSVNTTTSIPGGQGETKVTHLQDGGWLVTWHSAGPQGSDWNVYQQRYARSGTKMGLETQVNTHTLGSQVSPDVTALADGGWVVTWINHEQDGSEEGVYQQRYTAAGTTVGVETQVNSTTTGDHGSATVTALADGGWVVTWTGDEQDGVRSDVYQQRYAAAGTKAGIETQVNTDTTRSQGNSAVTALADGGWVVAWQAHDLGSSDNDIFQQRYAASGAKVDVQTQVNTTTTGNQSSATVTALADGGWVATWTGDKQGGARNDVYQQRYAASGTKAGVETQVNTDTARSQGISAVTARADGGWIVTWFREVLDGSGSNIYQQRYAGSGAKVGVEIQVNRGTDGYQVNPAIASLDDHSWIVVWAGRSGIYQQRYDADGDEVGGQL